MLWRSMQDYQPATKSKYVCPKEDAPCLFPKIQFILGERLKEFGPHVQFSSQRTGFPTSFLIRDRYQTYHWFRPPCYHNLFTLAGLLDELGKIRFCLMNSYSFHVS